MILLLRHRWHSALKSRVVPRGRRMQYTLPASSLVGRNGAWRQLLRAGVQTEPDEHILIGRHGLRWTALHFDPPAEAAQLEQGVCVEVPLSGGCAVFSTLPPGSFPRMDRQWRLAHLPASRAPRSRGSWSTPQRHTTCVARTVRCSKVPSGYNTAVVFASTAAVLAGALASHPAPIQARLPAHRSPHLQPYPSS